MAIATGGFALPAHAVVTDIVLHATAPYGVFAGGKFLRIDGEARGLLVPSEAIADIAAENPLFAPTQARTRGALSGAQR